MKKEEKPKYCQDCKHYDRLTKKCGIRDFYVRRKNFCEDWTK